MSFGKKNRRLDATVLLVGLSVALLASCPSSGYRDDLSFGGGNAPLELRLLSDGVDVGQEATPHAVFAKLKENGAFSYYVNDQGVKVDIESLGIEVVGSRGSPEWTADDSLVAFLVWQVSEVDGGVRLVPFLDARAEYLSTELLYVEVQGKLLRVTPKYQWTVNPEYPTRPPGVIQDIYVVSFADAVSMKISRVLGKLDFGNPSGGSIKRVELDGETSRELEKNFTASYRNAILGHFRTGLPTRILRRPLEASIDFADGVETSFNVQPGDNPIPFYLRSADRANRRASFKFGSDPVFTDVEVGDYRLAIDGRVAVRLASLDTGGDGRAGALRVLVYSVDDEEAVRTSVTVKFRDPKELELPTEIAPDIQADLFLSWTKKQAVWQHKKVLRETIITSNMDHARANSRDKDTSPDGKWRASVVTKTLSIEESSGSQRLVNVRLEPVSGPVAWSSKSLVLLPNKQFTTSAVGTVKCWSFPVTFLLEADLQERSYEIAGEGKKDCLVFGNTMTVDVPAGVSDARVKGVLNGKYKEFDIGEDIDGLRFIAKTPQEDGSVRYVYQSPARSTIEQGR